MLQKIFLLLEDGLMEESIMENGEKTRCMVMELLLGKMAGDMLANILMISKHFFFMNESNKNWFELSENKVWDSLIGQMGKFIKVIGRTENSTEEVSTKKRMEEWEKVNGKKERSLNG